jgi:hypothetical protein
MTNTARLVRSILSVSIPAIITAIAFGQTALQRPTGKLASDAQSRQDAKGKVEMAKPEQGSRERQVSEQVTAPERTDPLRLVSSGPNGVVLELAADSFSTASTSDGLAVSAPGFDRLAEPGEPDLPSRVILIGLPQTGGVRLSVSTEGTETVNGAGQVGGRIREARDGRRESRVEKRAGTGGGDSEHRNDARCAGGAGQGQSGPVQSGHGDAPAASQGAGDVVVRPAGSTG